MPVTQRRIGENLRPVSGRIVRRGSVMGGDPGAAQSPAVKCDFVKRAIKRAATATGGVSGERCAADAQRLRIIRIVARATGRRLWRRGERTIHIKETTGT